MRQRSLEMATPAIDDQHADYLELLALMMDDRSASMSDVGRDLAQDGGLGELPGEADSAQDRRPKTLRPRTLRPPPRPDHRGVINLHTWFVTAADQSEEIARKHIDDNIGRLYGKGGAGFSRTG